LFHRHLTPSVDAKREAVTVAGLVGLAKACTYFPPPTSHDPELPYNNQHIARATPGRSSPRGPDRGSLLHFCPIPPEIHSAKASHPVPRQHSLHSRPGEGCRPALGMRMPSRSWVLIANWRGRRGRPSGLSQREAGGQHREATQEPPLGWLAADLAK